MDDYDDHGIETPEAADPDAPDEFDQTPIEDNAFAGQARADGKPLADARMALDVAQTNVEQERLARREAEKVVDELKKDLADATTTIDQERQGRLNAEKDRTEAQAALDEANRAAAGQSVVNEELPSKDYSAEGSGQRLSFIVRLMLDEHSDPRRTEIEDTHTRRKESFHTLNGDQLAAFMRSCIRPVAIAASNFSHEIPVPESTGESYTMNISDTLVFDKGAGDTTSLSFHAREAFVVQAGFHLQAEEESPGQVQDTDFDISVYANEIGGSHSQLMASSYGRLQEKVLDYTARVEAPGLSPGVYRLVTLVTLHTPRKRTGHYEGPIILVN